MSSIIKVDQIQLANGSTPTAGDLGLNVAGAVLQVKQSVKTDSYTASTINTFSDPSLYVDITPTLASSKILVSANLSLANSQGTCNAAFKLQRVIDGTTVDFVGYDPGTGTPCTSGFHGVNQDATYSTGTLYLDSPSTTSTVRYKVVLFIGAGSTGTIYMNRCFNDPTAQVYRQTGMSTITAQEIAG